MPAMVRGSTAPTRPGSTAAPQGYDYQKQRYYTPEDYAQAQGTTPIIKSPAAYQKNYASAPLPSPTPPLVAAPTTTPVASPFGSGMSMGEGGSGAASALAAMQGLEAAIDPMAALSLPAGMREGLGRRAYPPLANALAGLRY